MLLCIALIKSGIRRVARNISKLAEKENRNRLSLQVGKIVLGCLFEISQAQETTECDSGARHEKEGRCCRQHRSDGAVSSIFKEKPKRTGEEIVFAL